MEIALTQWAKETLEGLKRIEKIKTIKKLEVKWQKK
jgi:hypothetical protein